MVKVFDNFLRKTEISQLDVTIDIYKNILRLQVSVQYIQFMKVLHAQDYLAYVRPCLVLCESFLGLLLNDLL